MTKIIEKYPEFDSYFRESDPLPVLIKMMATILFIRKKTELHSRDNRDLLQSIKMFCSHY